MYWTARLHFCGGVGFAPLYDTDVLLDLLLATALQHLKAKNVHITLAFLGSESDIQISSIGATPSSKESSC